MKCWLLAAVAVLFGNAFASAAEFPRLSPKQPTWFTDYAAARQVARATGKPLFVVFR
jgi:hypothetical protein